MSQSPGRAPTCPPPRVLEAFLSGGCDLEGGVAAHVQACLHCRSYVEEVRQNAPFLSELAAFISADCRPEAESHTGLPPALPVLPGYEFVREIGRGGQGVVYEAIQRTPKRRIAIKMLGAGALGTAKRRLRLEREAEITASLRHPGIATVFQSLHLPDGRLAIAMELVEGVPLDQWARRTGAPVPITRSGVRPHVSLIAAACDAIAHAHGRGVIHRDLKPSNILVDAGDHPHIVDFGVARHGERAGPADPLRTATGGFAGTIEYCSPEQVSGDPDQIDTRTDVYSLGLILYELVAGRLPYELDGPPSKMIAAITTASPIRPGPPPPRQGIDDELWTLLCHAMAKDRERRYKGVLALRDDLLRYLAGEAIEAKRDSTYYVLKKWARRRWLPLAALATVFIVLAVSSAALGWFAWRLEQRSGQLQASLSETTVERARLLTNAGGIIEAERQLYAELARASPPGVDLMNAAFRGRPETRPALWALGEIAARQPCVAAVRMPFDLRDGQTCVLAVGGNSSVAIFRASGEFRRYAVPSLQLQELRALETGEGVVRAVALSADLATACVVSSVELRLIDTSGGDVVAQARWPGPGNPVSAALDPSARRVLVHAADGTLWLWEPLGPGQAEPRALTGVAARALRSCFDPLSRAVYVANAQSGVSRVDPDTGATLSSLALPDDQRVSEADLGTLVVSQDGSGLAIAIGEIPYAIGLDTATTGWVRLPPHQTGTANIRLDSAARIALTSVAYESICRVVDVASGTSLREILVPGNYGATAALTPDGAAVVTLSAAGLLRVWRTVDDPWRHALAQGQSANAVAFSNDGSVLLTGLDDGRVLAWDPEDFAGGGHLVAWHEGVAGSVGYTQDGSRVVSLGYDGRLRFTPWPGQESGESPPSRVTMQIKTLGCMAVDPRGRYIACAGAGPNVVLYSQSSGEQEEVLQDGGPRPSSIAFSPDGRWLVWPRNNQIIVYDMDSGSIRASLTGHERKIYALRFAPDGSSLASGGQDERVRLWRTADWTLERELAPAQETIYALAFHPAGLVLAGGGRSATVRFWEMRDGRELASIGARCRTVLDLAFAPDGLSLAVAKGSNYAAERWDFADLIGLIEASSSVFAPTANTDPTETRPDRERLRRAPG